MKKNLILFLFMCVYTSAFSTGVCIVNANTESYLQLKNSKVDVSVNNQIATITSTQTFINDYGVDTLIKFAFPMTETGSAIRLRWQNFGNWYEADFTPSPQDTILPGGGGSSSPGSTNLNLFLGNHPLYFDLEQVVPAGGEITFELTYVDLLPYSFNVVSFYHPSDYSLIQSTTIEFLELNYTLVSDRTIDWLDLVNENDEITTNNGNDAFLQFSKTNINPDFNLEVEYQLNAQELGLFSFSTFIADSLLGCDEHGEGYMALIVEPDPSNNTQTIDKVFTLIIDKSGSMSGDKIVQARDAATFITNNLNPGDEFNIVAFSSSAESFATDHVPYNASNKDAALSYISGINSGGGTHMKKAFSEAIPDFENNDPSKAHIIIFFTDGQATDGSTQEIVSHVSDLVAMNNVQGLSIFTFGIGSNVNTQLLTLLALQNNGFSEFLSNQDLLEVISTFYLYVQNPVLLNTEMFFSPDIVIETYPLPLPNLFKGQQLIVVGRYETPTNVDVNFSGSAFGNTVDYNYPLTLTDTFVQDLQFLPRLWAKRKMEHLYFDYLAAGVGTPEADILNDSIVDISLCYGIVSPLTSFGDNSGGGGGVGGNQGGGGLTSTFQIDFDRADEQQKINVFPNPFMENTTFQYVVNDQIGDNAQTLKIVDASGKVIREVLVNLEYGEAFQYFWDGKDDAGKEVAPGVYFVEIQLKDKTVRGKVIKI